MNEIKTGHCKIDNVPSYIRKVKITDTRVIICYFKGKYSGHKCEELHEFLKHKIQYPPYDKPI